MPDTSTSAQDSNGAAGFAKHERLFLALAAGGIVFALVIGCLAVAPAAPGRTPAGDRFR